MLREGRLSQTWVSTARRLLDSVQFGAGGTPVTAESRSPPLLCPLPAPSCLPGTGGEARFGRTARPGKSTSGARSGDSVGALGTGQCCPCP